MARTKDFDQQEVLGKAVCLFWHKGYNGTSMQELVDNLGISRSSLYDTFGDKRTLYLKALEFYQNLSTGKICKMVSESKSAKEAVKNLLELATNDISHEQQAKGCFMVDAEIELAPHDHEVKDIICKNEKVLEDAFFNVIQQGIDQGEIPKDKDARALTRFIVNVIKGIRVSAKSTADGDYYRDIIKTTLTVLD